MFLGSLSKTLASIFRTTGPALGHCLFPQNPLVVSSFLRTISSNIGDKDPNQDQFTVSYLVNSCGLSLESAKSASKGVQFETPDKPDLFLSLLKSYHFSQAQISKVVKKCPSLLVSKPGQTVLPKLEFFRSKGLSDPEIARIISSWPYILRRSLNNHIIPTYDFFKGVLQSDEKTIGLFKRSSYILSQNVEAVMVRNFNILRDNGVPELGIHKLLLFWPSVLLLRPEKMEKIVEEARKMGFDPSKYMFLQAIKVLGAISKSTWVSKVDVFRKWNFSEEQVVEGFRRFPRLMNTSEERITAMMEFLVNKVGFEPPTCMFLQAINVLIGISKSTWESKVDVFRNWNLPEEEVIAAFRKYPRVMTISEKKITAIMELLVNKLGWEPSVVTNNSVLLALSLEKRLIPRALILQYLVSKGLIKKVSISPALFKYTDAKFHLKFVRCYPETSQLLKLNCEKCVLSK